MSNQKSEQKITLKTIEEAVGGTDAAFRLVTKLSPIGESADKVFPPTYAVEERNRADKYAKEKRVVDGAEVDTVLLDSVQSQANRMELALLNVYDNEHLDLPMVQVDFPSEFSDIGRITVLEAPHRLADAILRDSYLDKTLWRQTESGKRFGTASQKDASALLELCPTSLIFGIWDSTGELGGLGTKFARALVSEIVGFGSTTGEKTASRIDPLGIEKKGVTIYEHPTEMWTLDPKKATKDKDGQAVRLKSKDGTGDGSPSAILHGNIAPSIDATAGGASIRYAVQTTVLSLTRLRMLRFGKAGTEAQQAARAYLCALGLAAVACSREQGYWLRSRCELIPIPDEVRALELVQANGTIKEFAVPSADDACQVANAAAVEVRKHKLLPAKGHVLRLQPSEKLLTLVRLSRGMNVTT